MDEFNPAAHGWRPNPEPGFTAHIGPVWERPDGERTRYGMVMRDIHANLNGVVHGGVIATFADFSLALECRRVTNGARQATIQLDIHYLDAGRIGEFIEADCTVTRSARSVVFVTGRILAGDRLIATAQGVWKIQSGTNGLRP